MMKRNNPVEHLLNVFSRRLVLTQAIVNSEMTYCLDCLVNSLSASQISVHVHRPDFHGPHSCDTLIDQINDVMRCGSDVL